MVSTLNKRFGDRPDAKRGIKSLEAQVKKLYDMYYSVPPMREAAEDPVFIRRPLGGYSCASCDKDINNLYTMINQQPEYANWNKFPTRDPAERGPKVSEPRSSAVGGRLLKGPDESVGCGDAFLLAETSKRTGGTANGEKAGRRRARGGRTAAD